MPGPRSWRKGVGRCRSCEAIAVGVSLGTLSIRQICAPFRRTIAVVRCSCCGEERTAEQVGTLNCHPEMKVRRSCIDWLSAQAGRIDSTPTLPAIDMPATIAFYESAGFDVESYDGGFAFVQFEDDRVFDLDHAPDINSARNGAGCFLTVPDSDAWHARLAGAGLPVTPIEDKPWGMREFTLTDPNVNHVRIGSGS